MAMNFFETRPTRLNVQASIAPTVSLHSAVTPAAQVDPSVDGCLLGQQTKYRAGAFTWRADDRPAIVHEEGERSIQPLGGWSKRLVDIVIALVAMILASPVMLLVAILIRATGGAPAIFAQSRVGFNGKPFICYKFRTMVTNSEQALRDHLANNAQAAQEWKETRKLKHDPRITILGQMLRKSSLDELPQLINILRGDMSCVGPRPIMADELERYGLHANDYLRARPGLTGLWQVTGRNDTDYSQRVLLDSRYVRNWSLWGDLVILARTTVAVMRFDQTS
jgi:exopolysaccharide production protein ExoY